MFKYLPLLCLFGLLIVSCDDNGSSAPETKSSNTSTPVSSSTTAVDRIETKEQMKELVEYSVDLQRRIFNMPSDKSLSFTIGNNAFNMELYREENGDTLAVVNNGALGKYGEFDRYIFYQNNRPAVMLVEQLKMDVSRQMFTQLYTFYNNLGEVEPTAMFRNAQRKEEMLAKGFVAKSMGEVHKVRLFVDEFEEAMNHEGDYRLYFDEFLTEGGRSYLRFKTTNDPASKKYYVTAVRLPEDYKNDALLAKVEKNARLYQNKRVNMEWEQVKVETGALVPQWVSGTFE